MRMYKWKTACVLISLLATSTYAGLESISAGRITRGVPSAVVFSHDDSVIYIGSNKGTIYQWRLDHKSTKPKKIDSNSFKTGIVRIVPIDDQLCYIYTRDQRLYIYDIQKHRVAKIVSYYVSSWHYNGSHLAYLHWNNGHEFVGQNLVNGKTSHVRLPDKQDLWGILLAGSEAIFNVGAKTVKGQYYGEMWWKWDIDTNQLVTEGRTDELRFKAEYQHRTSAYFPYPGFPI